VWVCDVAGKQSAQCPCIVFGSPAAEGMGEQLYAVNIAEYVIFRDIVHGIDYRRLQYIAVTSVVIPLFQCPYQTTVRRYFALITQFFYEGFMNNSHIFIFTKHQWNEQPVVSRPHRSIGPMIPHEG